MDCRGDDRGSRDLRLRRAALLPGKLFRKPARLEAGAAEDRSQGIEDMVFGFFNHRFGKLCLPAFGDIGAEPADDFPGCHFFFFHFHPRAIPLPFPGQEVSGKTVSCSF